MGYVVKMGSGPKQDAEPSAKAATGKTSVKEPGASFLSELRRKPKTLALAGGALALVVAGVSVWLALGQGGAQEVGPPASPAALTDAPMGTSEKDVTNDGAPAAAPGAGGGAAAPSGGGMTPSSGAAPKTPQGGAPPGDAPLSGDMPPSSNLLGAGGGGSSVTSVSGVQTPGGINGGGAEIGGTNPIPSGAVDNRGNVNYDVLERHGLDSGEVARPRGFPTGGGAR